MGELPSSSHCRINPAYPLIPARMLLKLWVIPAVRVTREWYFSISRLCRYNARFRELS